MVSFSSSPPSSMKGGSRLERPSFQHVYVRRSRRYVASSADAGESMAGQSSPIPTPLRRSPTVVELPSFQHVYVRRSRRYVASPAGAGESMAGQSSPIPTPLRRSSRVVELLRSKMMKRKAATPVVKSLKNWQQTFRVAGAGESSTNKLARRKLDFESHGGAKRRWKNTIRLKVLKDKQILTPSEGTSKRGKKRLVHSQQGTEMAAIVPYLSAPTDPSSSSSSAMVMADHADHWKHRMRVDLDDDTLRVYDSLVEWDKIDSESFQGVDIGSGPGWNKTRQDFKILVRRFISTVRECLFGSRNFAPCVGSVIDSVVGTFLTQNAADHLSSDAFMNLAAKYPARMSCNSSENFSIVPLLTYERKSNLNLSEASDVTDFDSSAFAEPVYPDAGINSVDRVKGHHDDKKFEIFMEDFIVHMKEKDPSTWKDEDLKNLIKENPGKKKCSIQTLKRLIATIQVEDTSHWDKLRGEACRKGFQSGTTISNLVDWEAVLHASPIEVAKYIEVRGMNLVIACRIQAFLLRIKKDHGSFDLDWLRYVPRESAKNYLMSIHGLGYKSVDCIRLLSLEHKAFPVDVNISRICVRLGWVKLQGLPDSVAFHLIELYPVLSDVQKYLWPRLCTVDKEILYTLHCLMITFGKVVCTKVNPNCSACPFSSGCKYYSSWLNSKRASLPPAKKHVYEPGEDETSMATSSNGSRTSNTLQVCELQLDLSRTTENQPIHDCVPIIQMPPSPVYEHVEEPNEQEQAFQDDVPDIEDYFRPQKSQFDAEIDLCSHNHMVNDGFQIGNHGTDMVLSNTQATFGQQRKLKNIGRLRTEHYAYVLPDDHIILNEFEPRHKEDPHPYLLVISDVDKHMVKGTILIPFRTALRGNFPLKGTYFQDHEVFADYWSSHNPVPIPRKYLWNLRRRVIYVGSSIQSITKEQTGQDIKECYTEGAVCVRSFRRLTRYPEELCPDLHATKGTKESAGTSMEG